MRAEAYVIHLPVASRRRVQADALLARLPLPARIVEGVDGRLLSAAAIGAVYRRELFRPRYPFPLRNTEIGCFLSHRKAWQAIADSGLDAGLIVEDDVEPDDRPFGAALSLALGAVRPGDYIRFPYRSYTDKGAPIAQKDGLQLVEPRHAGLGMQMQLVGRDAALRLLAATETFDRPVDAVIQLRKMTGIRVLAMRPGHIREIGGHLGGTVVQKKGKPLGEIVSRAAKRAFYRLSVRLHDR